MVLGVPRTPLKNIYVSVAKGPGPGRLGLGGQGSWAGPAWLGGPRVLGRTGLAWEAKGPGPDRLGLGGQGSWAGPA